MPTTTVGAVVAQLTEGSPSEAELAVKVHNYVRDQVLFGFTPYFDTATAAQTLELRAGHCNPKGCLFVELCRKAGRTQEHCRRSGKPCLHALRHSLQQLFGSGPCALLRLHACRWPLQHVGTVMYACPMRHVPEHGQRPASTCTLRTALQGWTLSSMR